MNQIKKMDSFFDYISKILIQHPEITIDKDFIYANLTHYNIKKPSKKHELREYFSLWINYFKDMPHIRVFNTQNWKYFCQFTNREECTFAVNPIKIYVPQDEKHIFKSAILIFDFLAKNKIKHQSKIASDVRNDDIVIRVATKSDAEKIRVFVAQNDYILKGLTYRTPFAVSDGNISFTYDDRMSYNTFTATMIANYMNYMKEKRLLKKANVSDFQAYLQKYYEDTFVTKINLNSFVSQIGKTGRKLAEDINNCREMLELLIEVCGSDFKLEDFYTKWEKVNNQQKENKNVSGLMEELNTKKNNLSQTIANESLSLQKKCEILSNSILETIHRYNPEFALNSLRLLCEFQNPDGVTRENNARNNLVANIDLSEIKSLVEYMVGKYDLKLFIDRISHTEKKIDYNDLLYNAVYLTIQKYGVEHASVALQRALLGNFSHFTNDDNARDNLNKYFKGISVGTIIREFLCSKGYKPEEIIGKEVNLYMNNVNLLNNGKTR